ncbi:hypothetical protein SS50377_26932 [Spironucleus salmonicida]|uniref:Uncharacterized protein n=1 Tax=Spironucleus salmonicida TaxID=348837 RepID=V6LT59_9EUKA|nr:hypothetical protein SS50377_26932 [Spironucleus salmonicida]|eukprot:EST47443.1 hypothetical protein SS50377_12429 [Spironucleus salmonicida]
MSLLESDSKTVKSATINSRGTNYLLTSIIQHNQLQISLENNNTLDRWSRSFSAKQLDELTAKAGSQRKFSIFINMLLSAMDVGRHSETLKIDVKTPQELIEATKQNQTLLQAEQANRMFVIIAYKAEFEAIFYPLTLDKVNYDLQNQNEAYLLEAYKQSKQEIERLTELNNENLGQVNCQNCTFLEQEISKLERDLEIHEEQQQESLKVANLAVKQKEKYKIKLEKINSEMQKIVEQNRSLLEDNKKMYAKLTGKSRASSKTQRNVSNVSSRASSRSQSPSVDYQSRPTRSQILQQQMREKKAKEEAKKQRSYKNESFSDDSRMSSRRSVQRRTEESDDNSRISRRNSKSEKMDLLKNVNQTIQELKQLVRK